MVARNRSTFSNISCACMCSRRRCSKSFSFRFGDGTNPNQKKIDGLHVFLCSLVSMRLFIRIGLGDSLRTSSHFSQVVSLTKLCSLSPQNPSARPRCRRNGHTRLTQPTNGPRRGAPQAENDWQHHNRISVKVKRFCAACSR